jgi:glycosyltransferase involved in cell wall biosynthesis
MKLIIQIPCLNEEENLSQVLNELPESIPGISDIEIVVIDDGSTDRTTEIARDHGATLIEHKQNLGLGIAFKHGLQYALQQDVDILVNTDADNQYPSEYIPDLVKAVVEGESDLVIGNRKPWKIKHFSKRKRFFQYAGSFVVRRLTNTNVPDTVSGFRAYSKAAMRSLNITTKYSYVLDAIMQLSKKGLTITSVPIKTNLPTRESRLFSNMFQHIFKSAVNVLRVYAIYEPFRTFLYLSLIFLIPGAFLGGRFVYFYVLGLGGGHIQSLIATAILIINGVLLIVLGVIAELLKTNRMIVEEMYAHMKASER